MKIFAPVVEAGPRGRTLALTQFEVAEIAASEAPVAIHLTPAETRKKANYRLYQGRLFIPAEYDAIETADKLHPWLDRASALKQFIPLTEKRSWAKGRLRHPFLVYSDQTALIGVSRAQLSRDETRDDATAGSHMHEVFAEIARHSLLIDGTLYRETTGPLYLWQHVRKFRDVTYPPEVKLIPEVEPWMGISTTINLFGLSERDRLIAMAEEEGRPKVLGTINILTPQVPEFDTSAMAVEAAGLTVLEENHLKRLPDLPYPVVDRYLAIRDLLSATWHERDPAAPSRPTPSWPYKGFDRTFSAASQLAAMLSPENLHGLVPDYHMRDINLRVQDFHNLTSIEALSDLVL